MIEKSTETPIIPPSPGVTGRSGGAWLPEQIDPELANFAMARILVDKLGAPSKINKLFIGRNAIYKALNHTPENPTGFDTSLRLAVYVWIEAGSVNENGMYFDRLWAFLMKPKFIINALQQPGQYNQEEPKRSLWDRTGGRLFGGGDKNEPSR